MKDRYTKMLQLVKKAHAGQSRNNGAVPYWRHCYRTAQLLAWAIDQGKELPKLEKDNIILAALGHDLYEDTDVSRQEIVDIFGVPVDDLIYEVTNESGDSKIDNYIKKLKKDSQLALLIKLADLSDNAWDSAYSLHENGRAKTVRWQKILNEQWRFLSKKNFSIYPRTAELLRNGCAMAFKQLEAVLALK